MQTCRLYYGQLRAENVIGLMLRALDTAHLEVRREELGHQPDARAPGGSAHTLWLAAELHRHGASGKHDRKVA
jgi:hypothetical protein